MLYRPNIVFQSKTFYEIRATLSPARSEHGPCIKTLQVTIIQSVIDAAVFWKWMRKNIYTYLTRLPTSQITNSKVKDILERLVII